MYVNAELNWSKSTSKIHWNQLQVLTAVAEIDSQTNGVDRSLLTAFNPILFNIIINWILRHLLAPITANGRTLIELCNRDRFS